MSIEYGIAVVSDNADPDGLHRVQVSMLSEQAVVSDWISVMVGVGGSDCGMYVLPDVGEQVVVMSSDVEGKSRVVVGSVWDTVSVPPESGENGKGDLNSDGENALHFMKSRSGGMLIFDDTEGDEKLQLIGSGGGSRIEFVSKGEEVLFESDVDVRIGTKGVMSFEAEEIVMEASKEWNVESDTVQVKIAKSGDVECDGDMTLKGSGISIN